MSLNVEYPLPVSYLTRKIMQIAYKNNDALVLNEFVGNGTGDNYKQQSALGEMIFVLRD